ncbi:hypothetical protein EIP86_008024 [Pleurotus ostreatoroseus]|nr:hypothetical protein EIP86_008024 [Pleurotus ostreatoroseus]
MDESAETSDNMPGGHLDNSVTEPVGEIMKYGEPPADGDDKGAKNKASHETESDPWETVLTLGNDNDKALIEKWKDEMDNLLIFAGLFSAVVTAFTIESYQWLVETPPDPSIALLTRISDQLSSFATPIGSVNSTVASATADPPHNSSTSTIASPVSINTLWFLSLTLSLISAFYAIAVQQWLRQLTTPRHLLPRDAARLRQWRYDNLMSWQIPSIISVLPLLIQSAVILFLIGVLLLLDSLNKLVALAFIIVAVIGMAPFIVTVILPVIFPACPFKSPVIPSVLAVAQWCIVPAVLAITLAIILFNLIVFPLAFVLYMCSPTSLEHYVADSADIVFDVSATVVTYLFRAIAPSSIGLENFWADRETKALSTEAAEPEKLDVPALSQAIAVATGKHALGLRAIIHTLPSSYKTRCILHAVTTSIGLRFFGEDSLLRRLVSLIHAGTNILLHEDHAVFIIEVLNTSAKDDEYAKDTNIAPLLLFLHLATSTKKLRLLELFPVLTNTCARQSSVELVRDPELEPVQRIPTVILCVHLNQYSPVMDDKSGEKQVEGAIPPVDEELAQNMVSWAIKHLIYGLALEVWETQQKDLVKRSTKSLMHVVQVIEFILASSAIALKAISIHPTIIAAEESQVDELLSKLNEFLSKARQSRLSIAIRSFKSSRDHYMLLALPVAIEMICVSFADLAQTDVFPLGDNSQGIAKALRDCCRDQDGYNEAIKHLELFWLMVNTKTTRQTQQPGRSARLGMPKVKSVVTKLLRLRQNTSTAGDTMTTEAETADATGLTDLSPATEHESTPDETAPSASRPRLANTIRRVMNTREYMAASLAVDLREGADAASPDATVLTTALPPTGTGAAEDLPTTVFEETSIVVAEPEPVVLTGKPLDEATSSFSPLLDAATSPFGLLTPELTPMQEFVSPTIDRERHSPFEDLSISEADKPLDDHKPTEHNANDIEE